MLAKAGNARVVREFREIAPGMPIATRVMTLDRDFAAERKSSNLALFVYNPPKVFFTDAEQELLLAALDGGTDDVLSARLGIPMTATKAPWNRVQARVAERVPALLGDLSTRIDGHGQRGPQFRHLIVDYVRNNPSELTPCIQMLQSPRRKP